MKRSIKHNVVIALLLFYSTALAVSPVTPDGKYEYDINKDNLTVTIADYHGEGGFADIPERIDGRLVTCIGDAAFQNAGFTGHLTIPQGVRIIGERAQHFQTIFQKTSENAIYFQFILIRNFL